MLQFAATHLALTGQAGSICLPPSDELIRKIAMLYEGQCEGVGATRAARKFGLTRQRYHQLLRRFQAEGSRGLLPMKTGPKKPSRRTPEVTRQVIRHLFLDRKASPEVVAQKIRQLGLRLSIRSVQRIVAEYGLQKKTPHGQPQNTSPTHPNLSHPSTPKDRVRRPHQPRTKSPPDALR